MTDAERLHELHKFSASFGLNEFKKFLFPCLPAGSRIPLTHFQSGARPRKQGPLATERYPENPKRSVPFVVDSTLKSDKQTN